jgi:hypothetical protein
LHQPTQPLTGNRFPLDALGRDRVTRRVNSVPAKQNVIFILILAENWRIQNKFDVSKIFCMNKKTGFQIVLLVVLLGVAACYWSALSKPPKIQILFTVHGRRVSRPADASANPPRLEAAFGMDQPYELTSVKVVPLVEWTTNKEARPLWHLTAKTNSQPVKAFIYGQNLEGMESVTGASAEPLATNVDYLLLIEAGRQHGECDFKLP